MQNLVRVMTISPEVHIGNVQANIEEIKKAIQNSQANIIVTPELSLVGYTTQDLMFNKSVYERIMSNFDKIIADFKDVLVNRQTLIVGAPIVANNNLYNCAIIINCDGVLGIVPKCYLPNYSEFYEKRWFKSALEDELPEYLNIGNSRVPFGHSLLVESKGFKFGVEICEDLWAPNPPSVNMCMNGAEVILNLSASNETIGKSAYRRNLVAQQSARCICGYVYCSAGSSESTSDIVFSGHNIIAENGHIIAESDLFDNTTHGMLITDIDLDKIRHDRLVNKTFTFGPKTPCREVKVAYNIIGTKKNTLRKISMTPFVPSRNIDERCREIFDIQTEGLARRWLGTGSKHIVLGVSGGLDSTLALLVCVGAANKLGYSRDRIVGLTMPCFGTTSTTKTNAVKLMEVLGVTCKEINIENSVKQHLSDLGLSDDDRSVAYENAQARERTHVLMDYANMIGGFVVGTGDLSELALGWCTYNADHMSMYNVNGSIPKTLVRTMVRCIGTDMANGFKDYKDIENEDLLDCIKSILDTPVSPELLPPSSDGTITQLTEDSVGPYVLNDFFLYYTLRYGFDKGKIHEYVLRAIEQSDEYKYSNDEVIKWLNKFYERFTRAQFKRNCCPDCIKVGSVSFSPRGDWRMASEVDVRTFGYLE
jgi:NAD+ synthase (glutamine-hydrolysing)